MASSLHLLGKTVMHGSEQGKYMQCLCVCVCVGGDWRHLGAAVILPGIKFFSFIIFSVLVNDVKQYRCISLACIKRKIVCIPYFVSI